MSEKPKIKVLYLTAKWCGPCKAMKPILKKLLEERDDVELVTIDVGENTPVIDMLDVKTIPLFVATDVDYELPKKCDGPKPRVLAKMAGTMSFTELKAFVDIAQRAPVPRKKVPQRREAKKEPRS